MKRSWPLIQGLKAHFRSTPKTVTPAAGETFRLSGKRIRIPITGQPFQVEMGRQRLHVYPAPGVVGDPGQTMGSFILFDPERFSSGIYSFLRLLPHQRLVIRHQAADQSQMFTHPREAFRRHLQIEHEGNALVFKDPISELGTYVSIITDEALAGLALKRRHAALDRILRIYGGPLEPLAPGVALETLKAVNEALRTDPYRREDSYANRGGLLELPPNLTPILVGDLHGQVDNLLKILSENAFLECLEKGTAALIFLGDAIHPEQEGQLDCMDSSMLIMDLIFKLKLHFPSQVFFLIGNHDSFSIDVMKAGVPQSLIWEKKVATCRGMDYRSELNLFYQQSPVVALSADFLTCHAGPPRSKVSKDILVNIRQFPDILHQLTWTRVKSPAYLAGYSRGDVDRFRRSLGLRRNFPFIVAHYPFSETETLWQNVGRIENHHIVYSARPNQVGIFTRVGGEMVPQVYPAEPLLEWVNQRARAVASSPGQDVGVVTSIGRH